MTLKQQIKILCIQKNITMALLAEKLGTSPQNLSQRLAKESLTIKDFKRIAKELDIEYESAFILEDGTRISL